MLRTRLAGYRYLLSSTPGLMLLLFTLCGAADSSADNTTWQLVKQEGDITVYTREVAGSPFLAVKGTVLIDRSSDQVSALLGTGSSCAEWRAMCKSSKVIETVSEHERYIYMVLDLPWPIADRDLVMHTRTVIDDEARTATVSLNSDSERHPPQDHIRAETRGQFLIRVIEEEQVEFTYIMHTDLGGNLPADMVNSRLTTTAIDDLSRLQKLAES